MGAGSSSKNKLDIMNQTLNNAFISSIQNCGSSSLQLQEIDVKGSGNVLNDVQMKQVVNSVMKCASSQQAISDMAAKMAETIKQTAAAQNIALVGALQDSSSETDTNIKNIVSNYINMQSVQNITSNAVQKQTIKVDGANNVLMNISMDQFYKNLTEAAAEQVAKLSSAVVADTSAEQSSTSTSTNFIAEIFDSVGKMITGNFLIFAIILIACIGGFLIWWSSGGADFASQGMDLYAEQQGLGQGEEQYGEQEQPIQ